MFPNCMHESFTSLYNRHCLRLEITDSSLCVQKVICIVKLSLRIDLRAASDIVCLHSTIFTTSVQLQEPTNRLTL